MFHACPLPEEGHIHGYGRMVFIVREIRGFMEIQAMFPLALEPRRSLNRQYRVGSDAKKSKSPVIKGIRYLGCSSPHPTRHETRQGQAPTSQIAQKPYCFTSKVTVPLFFTSVAAEQLSHVTGNAGNPLHRLPVFKTLLSHPSFKSRVGLVAVAPRSYWKSTPTRPSERGILGDYTHALNYTIKRWPNSRIVIYGHSLGGSAAVCLTSALDSEDYPNVQGLILENPFSSIPEMVKALYPQRWLPYHYLTPFVWDTWDAVHAASNMPQSSLLWRLSKDMLVLLSEKDELVPNWMGMGILNATKSKGTSSVVIRDALHETAWEQGQWVREVAQYVGNTGDRS